MVMTMNQLDIEERLDRALVNAESDLEKVFALRLKSILFQITEMYRKYDKNGELSFTELNKYNRFQKEMKLISDLLTEGYKEIIKKIPKLPTFANMGFSIPSVGVIKQAIMNPIAELALPKMFEAHRDEIVRKINIEIAQGLIAGEGYSLIAKRLERQLGFASKKARLVARTEVGRSRSIAAEKVLEQASEYAKMTKVWASMLDQRVRTSHRFLDGKDADKNGLFHYKSNKTTAPRLWKGPDSAALSIQCRCVLIMKVNGKLPEHRRERDYMDDNYQKKLAARIDRYMADEGLTYIQSLKKAQKEIQAPSRVIPYVSYEEWSKGKTV